MSRRQVVWVVAVAFFGLAFAGAAAAQTSDQNPPGYVVGLLGAYAAADVLDMTSTGAALARGAREANPLLRPLSAHPATLGLANGVLQAGAIYTLWKMGRRHPKRAAILAGLAVAFEISVARHNLQVIHHSR
jgi:hypothetical protein